MAISRPEFPRRGGSVNSLKFDNFEVNGPHFYLTGKGNSNAAKIEQHRQSMLKPWNIVMRHGVPFALIDWEAAGPVNRLTEVAMVAWTCAQLYDDDIAEINHLPDARSRLKLVRCFVDAYGLSVKERHQLAYRLIELAIQNAAAESVEHRITPDTTQTPGLWGIVWRARSAAWMMRNRAMLDDVLK